KRLGEEDARRLGEVEVERVRKVDELYYRFIQLLETLSRLGVESFMTLVDLSGSLAKRRETSYNREGGASAGNDNVLLMLEKEIELVEGELRDLRSRLEELKKPIVMLTGEEDAKISDLRALEEVFSKLRRELLIDVNESGEPRISGEEVARILGEIGRSYDSLKERLEKIRAERERWEETRRLLDELEKFVRELPETGEFENLISITGFIDASAFEKFQENIKDKALFDGYRLDDGRFFLHIVCLKEYYQDVVKQLSSLGFKADDWLGVLPRNIQEAHEVVLKKLEKLDSEEDEVLKSLDELRRSFASKAGEIMSYLRINLKLGEALLMTFRSENVRLIQGWVPVDKVDYVMRKLEKLREEVDNALYFKFEDPGPGEEVPTVIKNPRLFRVFEPIVAQYGWPGSKEIDPTILSGILWTTMFGLMFPDLGHGIIVMALGAFFAYVYKGRFLEMNSKRAGRMMIWLGASSSIFGLLFGEFLLMEFQPIVPGLRPGWIGDPSSVIWLIKIAIFFGAAQLILAMGLAIIRHLREGRVAEAILGQHGLAGVISFIGFLLTAFHFIGITIIPGVLRIPSLGIGALMSWPFFLMITGVAMMVIKPFITKELAIEGISGMLEALIAFMANTFSYTRIAGFAVVHAAFAMVVHKLMEVNLLMGIGVGMIFLNLFAITIELLVCIIQALRLLYYEFLTKFYEGRGFPYAPWKL
ncbi:hypothetical protein KEJ32_06240, partial [Candidatus Bathyarchaeota archaeon]|nr:hypothetical protein [Candidatus Bathyarchaeota archaeon]